MRLIGHLPDEELARRFADYMLVQHLESQVEPEGDGRWAVWIIDDEHIEEATEKLARYRSSPNDDRFKEAATSAREKRDELARENEQHARRQRTRDSIWPKSIVARAGRCTFSLVAISVVVFVLMQVDSGFVRQWLSIIKLTPVGEQVEYSTIFLYDILHGQVWRVFTPMFIHFDILHIFMNMWLLVDLGGAVERRYGSRWTLLLVLIISAVSNLLEYVFSTPFFGGMSGVVFGLFGFVLVQSKYNPFSNFYVSPMMTGILLVWFVYCIVGLPGEIANFVHWGGLASGAVIGYVSSQYSIHRPNK